MTDEKRAKEQKTEKKKTNQNNYKMKTGSLILFSFKRRRPIEWAYTHSLYSL